MDPMSGLESWSRFLPPWAFNSRSSGGVKSTEIFGLGQDYRVDPNLLPPLATNALMNIVHLGHSTPRFIIELLHNTSQ